MKQKTVLMVLFLIAGLAGCEYSRLTMGGSPDTQYHRTLQSLTQHQRLYGLDKTLYETFITYANAEFSRLYAEEYAKIFSLSDEKKESMIKEKLADETKYDDFMIAHFASDHDNQKLNITDPQKIVWKFFLKTESGQIEPLEISQVQLGTQKAYFYPYLNAWSELYRIRFPKTNAATKTLIMTGPIRELSFVWK